MKQIFSWLCLVVATSNIAIAQSSLKFKVEDIGSLGGGKTQPYAININGDVVGSSTRPDGSTSAFIYSKGKMSDLSAIVGGDSVATGINDVGHIVGHRLKRLSDGRTENSKPFSLKNGVIAELSAPGFEFRGAHAINDGGQIVITTDFQLLLLDTESARIRQIDVTNYAPYIPESVSLNSKGDVVAWRDLREGFPHRRSLETVFFKDGVTSKPNDRLIYSINDNGTSVGKLTYKLDSGFSRVYAGYPFLNSQSADIQLTSAGGQAQAINNKGHIVGTYYNFSFSGLPDSIFLSVTGNVVDLYASTDLRNLALYIDVGYPSGRQLFINDKDQVLVWSSGRTSGNNVESKTYLLTPLSDLNSFAPRAVELGRKPLFAVSFLLVLAVLWNKRQKIS